MQKRGLSTQEYIALTAMRAIVKSLNRIASNGESFRNPLVRRLVVSACGVLRECVSEIESYDPDAIVRENTMVEPDIESAAARDARDASPLFRAHLASGFKPFLPAAPAPVVIPAPVEKPKRVFSEQARANLSAWGSRQHTCPHCQATGRGPYMFKKHFNRCAMRPVEVGA